MVAGIPAHLKASVGDLRGRRLMKKFKDMTPMQRIAVLRKTGVTVFPKLSQDEKRGVMYVENEPSVSAQKREFKLALY